MMEVITLDDLDAVLARAGELFGADYGAAIRFLSGVQLELPPPPPSAGHPFGPDYAAWVMETYRRVAAVDRYEAARHEADCHADIDMPFTRFFPFNTQDLPLIGRYMAGVGMILAELALPPDSYVVEYGVGWGHVAVALARAGHRVTCVDIEPKFLRLAERQAESLGCTISTHHGAFGDCPFPSGEPKADAVVFFEAFHHAFHHLAVLHRLRRDVLRPGGVLVLAAEPVTSNFPSPWGVRTDGHALWAIRQSKWMELGFQEDYLLRCLAREGFSVARTCHESLGGFGLLYRGTLHEGSMRPGETMLPSDEAASWAPLRQGETWRWAQVYSRATLDHDAAWVAVSVSVMNRLSVPLDAVVDCGGSGPAVRRRFAPGERSELRIALPPSGRELRVWSETAVPATLGLNDDTRMLGVAVEELRYHDR